MTKNSSNCVAVGAAAMVACGTATYLAYLTWMRAPKCPNAKVSDEPTKQGFSMKKVPPNLDVIVIGSGIGGLTVAAILAKEGKRVLVLEQHDIAGGNLHTFTEKGYEFDTGLHYIGGKVGDKSSSPTRKQLDYISDNQVEWEPMDDVYDVAVSGAEEFRICSSWTRLKKELKTSFPAEAEAIDTYFDTCDFTTKQSFPFYLLLKMLPERLFRLGMWLFDRKVGIIKKTTKEVVDSIIADPKLRGVLTYHYGDYGEHPSRGAFLVNAMITSHYRSGAYYPVGGPLHISDSIVRVIEQWGGKVLVRAKVDSVLMDKRGRACGVVVKGKDIRAKAVISDVGAPATMTKLVPESHRHRVSGWIERMADPAIAPDMSLMSMFVGINDPEGTLRLPKCNFWLHPSWDFDKNVEECKKDPFSKPTLFISFSSAKDPEYATRHPGKHVALVIGSSHYEAVEKFKDKRVKHRGKEYDAMKEKWQEIYMAALLDRFPELHGKVDYVEVGTALTNDFYLGTHRGAIYGLAHTPKRFMAHWLRPQTPIKNLWITGQDACLLGITGAMAGGYQAAYAVDPRSFFRTMSFMG